MLTRVPQVQDVLGQSEVGIGLSPIKFPASA